MRGTSPRWPELNHPLAWLLVSLLLVIAPHAGRLPLWIPLWFTALALGQALNLVGGSPLAKDILSRLSKARHALTLALLLGVYLSYGTLLGRDAGVALLVVLSGLKLLELRAERDHYVLVFMGYFLVITNFFYSQTIPTAAYMLMVVTVITATLIALNDTNGKLSIMHRMRLSASLLVQSLPIMLVAFLLFPRLSGPLWSLPNDAYIPLPGLADEMALGAISHLSQSEAVAFRAKFHGATPKPSELYWRGPVLWSTDGQKWTRGVGRNYALVPVYVHGTPYTYTITLEPHNQRWLFVLDMPSSSPPEGRLTRDFQLIASAPVRQRLRYTAQSYPHYRINGMDLFEKARGLQLPITQHPRTLALAKTWREMSTDPEQLVQRGLAFFNREAFYYTLTPPLIEGDSVDGFMFDTRRGFCEHYAAAFATLMRGAGIPSRIVTGYHGGEYNPIGDYFILRQRDAHAWVEVWSNDRGWVRIDPTTAIHPSRVELGTLATTAPGITGITLGLEGNETVRELWRSLRNAWDATKNQWNQWVLGYGPQRQAQLLSGLGMGRIDWRGMTFGLVIAVAIILFGVALGLFVRRAPATDPARAAYDRFCRKLGRRGIIREASEGPIDYAHRATALCPERAREIEAITDLYVRLRYSARQADLNHLKAGVRHFHP